MSHYDEMHDFRIRNSIGYYLDEQIRKNELMPWEKYGEMNKYLNLIEETPMILFSANRSPKHYLENNKIVIPDNYMLKFDEWCN